MTSCIANDSRSKQMYFIGVLMRCCSSNCLLVQHAVTVVISPILQVLNIRKFLQQVHSSGDGSSSPHPLLLPPDVFMEVGDIVFQLCDDPFEVKLRANYEVCVNVQLNTFWCHKLPHHFYYTYPLVAMLHLRFEFNCMNVQCLN